MELTEKRRQVGRQLLLIGIAALVMLLLVRTLGGVRFDEVGAAIARLPATTLALAAGLAALGYLWITGYDLLSLRYLGRRLPPSKVVPVSLAAFALQRNVGPGVLTGGAIRYRYLRRFGISGGDAAVTTLLCGLCFSMGIVLVAGLALLLEPQALAGALGIAGWPLRLAGLVLLAGLASFMLWTHYRAHPIRLRSYELPPPSLGLSLGQLLLGAVDLMLVAGVIYVLLPADAALGYPAFLGLYVLALVAGALSHVPGGVGVFESVLLVLLPGLSASEALASLLAFRGIYYLLPLLLMGLGVGLHEAWSRLACRR